MSIYDVAKKAGVSISTVSRVLNGSQNVRESTRLKVQAVMKEMHFEPNQLARDLSNGNVRNIAYFVPDIENPFFGKVMHGINDMARKLDYNIFMVGTNENPELEHTELRSLHSGMVKGILITPVSCYDEETKNILCEYQSNGIPVVLIDRDITGSEFDGVFSDDVVGSFNIVNLLAKERHRHIAIIAGPETSRPGYERIRGYKRAMKANNLSIDPEYMPSGEFCIEESYKAMEHLMNLEVPPTAVFTSNNMTTLGVLKYMQEHGLRLCDDICIGAFDDIPELVYAGVPLTAVTRDLCKMGSEAMRILNQRFSQNDESPDSHLVYKSFIKASLIVRGSEKFRNNSLLSI